MDRADSQAGTVRLLGLRPLLQATYNFKQRWIHDLPILDAETRLCRHRFRVDCPTCGPRVERLNWLEKYSRVTARLDQSVARLCRVMPIKAVAEFYDLGWDAVKAIDKACLQRALAEPDLSELTQLAMDEFAIKRGQRYATIFVEPQRKDVLWVCRGRSRANIQGPGPAPLHLSNPRVYQFDVVSGFFLRAYILGVDSGILHPTGFDFIPDAGTDCNFNQTPDNCDIASGFSLDVNRNGIPDECEPGRPGDMNCDGLFNGGDIDPFFLALGDPAAYAIAFPNCDPLLGDMNSDGRLDGGDIDPFFACLGGGACP